MSVSVLIPSNLRKLTKQQDTVLVDAHTIDGLVGALDTIYPGVAGRVRDESGEIRRYVNIYVNNEDIRYLQGADTPVRDGDNVSIISQYAGG